MLSPVSCCDNSVAILTPDKLGDIGPFQLAIGLTFITLLLILSWRENYGDTSGKFSVSFLLLFDPPPFTSLSQYMGVLILHLRRGGI